MSDLLPDDVRLMFRGFLHEIRNPMSAVLTATALLRDPSALPDDEVTNLLEMVDGETRHINRIINEFDHYLHLQQPVMEPFDLAAAVRNVLAELRREQLLDGKIEVIDELPRAQQAHGDGVQISEALRAILLNALQALEGSAQTPLQIQLSLQTHPGQIALLVQDNGEGFHGECLQRAFEPFYSTRPGACGLGLPLAQAIAHQHQGSLEIIPPSSQPGACLRMTFLQ